jgi:predicted ATPase
LGLELASRLKNEFPAGVFYVPLGAITEPELVAPEIMLVLGIMEKAGGSAEVTLKEFLKSKRILLLLDNFEQIIDAATLVVSLLHDCEQMKVIVTSRAPLRVRGEYEFPVLPLEVPDLTKMPDSNRLSLYAAVALFVQCAQAITPDFIVTSENARPIAEICARLDGLPLALELAAARTRILPLADLLSRLRHRLDLLTGGPRDLPVRHQTLRNAIAWSYDLLDDRNKRLFGQLSVFTGGFSIEAARQICGDGDRSVDVVDQLSRLVEGSLLLTEPKDSGIRFRMLETIREFANETLVASGEAPQVQGRFANFFISLAHETTSKLMGPQQAGMLASLDREHDNFRAALSWSFEHDTGERTLDFASTLWNFWNIRGHHTEGRVWLTRALEKSGPIHSVARARALIGAGGLAKWQDDFAVATSLLNEALGLCRELGDKEDEAYALNYLANVADDLGNFADAKKMYEESLVLFRDLGNRWGEALVLNNLGVGARYRGDYVQATEFQEESLRLFTELGDKRRIAHSLINLGSLLERRGQYDTAQELAARSLSLFQELNGRVGIAESCLLLGIIARKQHEAEKGRKKLAESLLVSQEIGYREIIVNCLEESAAFDCMEHRPDRAAILLSAAEKMRTLIPFPIPPAYLEDKRNDLSSARTALGEEKFKAQWQKGQLLNAEEAIAYALEPEPSNS